ncbi:hypothetical protein EV651_102354 [Kribbella sp. VKM Ac-2571]|uniref:hypothetical protein n=1 Tax=Kribbella sp. VKM Ac-2571 TaxID=2512222 RepID=UPI00105B6FF0|nr:hypothetical protein [Kribbella sp. VKM Ac-2571]TDO68433.1 hypothetical protein EV651_102354 [Kribbella sp. VKM Ac-2571]
MTGDLKTLMDKATDRGTSFAPDVTELVATGRRRTRRRRAMLGAGTAVGAATAVIAVLLVGRIVDPQTKPQPATVAQPAAITDLCAKSDDFFRTANDDAWRRQVVAGWTDKVVEVSDADGAMTVRRSPDGSQYAYCVAGVPIQKQPLGGFGATLLNVGIVTREYQIQRYWSMGCGNEPVERDYQQTSCRGVRYSYAGRVPEGVTRIAFTGLGQQGDATVKDGYWVHRVYTDNILKGNTDPIYITMYDDSGKQVFKERY